MRRHSITPRDHWQRTVERQGLYFHTVDGRPYWDESVYYHFGADEIDLLERATYQCSELCLEAVRHVIDNELFDLFLVPPEFVPFVKRSWEEEENTIYGRFDFSYRPGQPPKLMEYNADTPTALLEAAVVQWFWLKDVFPGADQFNSIHERLQEIFRVLHGQMRGECLYFTALKGNLEDFMTVNYLRDVAMQSGFGPGPGTAYLDIEDVGWDPRRRVFTDRAERVIRNVFKLYPWEWLVRERFGPYLREAPTRWLEPAWKMLLSNKAILPVLWHLFREDPDRAQYLLPAGFDPAEMERRDVARYVRKPILAREGANVALVDHGRTVLETEGPYGGPFIYQANWELPSFEGNYPVIGSWIVNGHACGIGIREDQGPVTQNTSRFVPHLFS